MGHLYHGYVSHNQRLPEKPPATFKLRCARHLMLWNGHIVHASHQTSGATPRKKIGQRIFWNLLKHLGNTRRWHFLGIFWLKSRSISTFGGIQLVGCFSSSSSHIKPYKTETNRLPFQEQPLKTRRNTSRNIKKQPRNTLVTCNSQIPSTTKTSAKTTTERWAKLTLSEVHTGGLPQVSPKMASRLDTTICVATKPWMVIFRISGFSMFSIESRTPRNISKTPQKPWFGDLHMFGTQHFEGDMKGGIGITQIDSYFEL